MRKLYVWEIPYSAITIPNIVMISPSNLPWWGWLLCCIGAAIVGWLALFLREERLEGDGYLLLLTAIVSGLAALGAGAIGVILFVKWVWNG